MMATLGCYGRRGSNSMVESQPSKLLVAGSIPVSRSRFHVRRSPLLAARGRSVRGSIGNISQATVAQSAERQFLKLRVGGSIPSGGSTIVVSGPDT